jgi:hypothetical protein
MRFDKIWQHADVKRSSSCLARSREEAGVGHGIFLYDFRKVR